MLQPHALWTGFYSSGNSTCSSAEGVRHVLAPVDKTLHSSNFFLKTSAAAVVWLGLLRFELRTMNTAVVLRSLFPWSRYTPIMYLSHSTAVGFLKWEHYSKWESLGYRTIKSRWMVRTCLFFAACCLEEIKIHNDTDPFYIQIRRNASFIWTCCCFSVLVKQVADFFGQVQFI